MLNNDSKKEKLFYSISEVAEMFDTTTSKIRFYSNNFDILKPRTNKKGNRMFTSEDLENFKNIFHLLNNEGMTIKGAIQKLSGNKNSISAKAEVVYKLKKIRKTLLEIKGDMS